MKSSDEIPTWIFFPLLFGLSPSKKWNEEKESLALRIVKSLKEKAEQHDWPPEVLGHVLRRNKWDDPKGYMVEPKVRVTETAQ